MADLADALIDAALASDGRRIASLLERGADANQPDVGGTTPLYTAAVQGFADGVRLLLRAGADADLESLDASEGLPLCAAACWGYTEVVRELLAAGADPNGREDRGEGRPPLHWAAANGHPEVARALLDAGADPNIVAGDGVTALLLAARRGSLAIVCALLDAGASDPDGQALAAAEEWIGKDVEAELRAQFEKHYADRSAEIVVERHPRGDGTDLIEVEARLPNGVAGGDSAETGYERIVALLDKGARPL